MLDVLAGADPWLVGLSCALAPASVALSAAKWHLLARANRSALPYPDSVRVYLIGCFYNHLLPSNVGGDVVRGYIAGRRTGRLHAAFASVLTERATGFFVLLMGVWLTIPLSRPELGGTLPVFLLVTSAAVLVWPVLLSRTAGRFVLRLRRTRFRALGRFIHAIRAYRHRPTTLVVSLAMSLVFYAGTILDVYLSAHAFGAPLTLAAAALTTPLILLAAALPLSIGGLGLLEGACVVLLGAYGISAEVALAAALLMRAKNVGLGLVGAAQQLVEPDRPAPPSLVTGVGR